VTPPVLRKGAPPPDRRVRDGRAADAALTVEGLTVRAGDRDLVADVSFTVGARERVGIIGASGSGKTLTCLAVAGLVPSGLSVSGSIRLAGVPVDLARARERQLARVRGSAVGLVFQEPLTALNPTMTVGAQVAEALRRGGRPRRAARVEAVDLLAGTGLPDPERIARSFPHQLSGGQRQRVVLAIALANRPGLLVCDEPTTALDVTVQARVLQLIADRTQESGSALLFISHDLAVVAQVCDRVLVLDGGRVVEEGAVVDVLQRPEHPVTRRLLADADLGGEFG
jgi:ABC-type glutathione transport system ATPase component